MRNFRLQITSFSSSYLDMTRRNMPFFARNFLILSRYEIGDRLLGKKQKNRPDKCQSGFARMSGQARELC